MLIGNGSVQHKSPTRFMAGSTTSAEPQLRAAFGKQGMLRNRFYQDMATNALKLYSLPEGAYAPVGTQRAGSAWMLPQTGGAMASRSLANGAGGVICNGNLGLPAAASLSGSGDITQALLALVVSAVASLSGSGTLTAGIIGKLEAAAALAGSGNLAGAAGALASMLAGLSGSGGAAGTPYASGSMSANIKGYGDLTPEGIRDSIWNALAANYNTTGTMGNKLNSAASGGVDYAALGAAVWEALTADHNTAGTFGAEVQAGGATAADVWAHSVEGGLTAEQLMRVMGAALAGKVAGADTGNITFTGVDGTTTRIDATVDGTGNRTTVTLNGA